LSESLHLRPGSLVVGMGDFEHNILNLYAPNLTWKREPIPNASKIVLEELLWIFFGAGEERPVWEGVSGKEVS
jgi:hypothetical protein